MAVRDDHDALARIRPGPMPSASVLASRDDRITPGTALNLFVGKKPGRVVDWTASGASSLNSSLSFGQGRRVGCRQTKPIAQDCGVERRFTRIGIAHRRMVEQIGKGKAGLVAGGVQPVIELLAQRRMKRTIDEVVRLFDPDLPASLRKIACAQLGPHRRWPIGQLDIEQFGRPAAPGQGPAANGEEKAGIIECRMIDPRHAQVRRTTHKRHVLHVLGQDEGPGFENQNAPAARRIRDKEMLRDDAAEGAAADDDGVETTGPAPDGLRRTVERLLQGVAEEAPHIVQRESGRFRGQ